MGDGNFFRDVTGLNPEHFLDEALESHLAASQLSVRSKAAQEQNLESRAENRPHPRLRRGLSRN